MPNDKPSTTPAGTPAATPATTPADTPPPDIMRRIVEDAGVGAVYTALDGRYLFANLSFARLFGFPSVERFLAADIRAQDLYADPADQLAIRTAIDYGQPVDRRLLQAKRTDGTTVWVREQSAAVRDETGAITGYISTITDVSDLVATQGKLAEAEESYRRIFERATEGIYRSSLDGKQLRSNPALNRLNGYETEEEHLKAVKDIATEWYVDPTRRAEFKRLLERDGSVKDFESEIYGHGSRKRMWISENAYLVTDEAGNPLFYEGTVRDITERKRAELATQEALMHAEAASKAKSDFLAHMSHELRTPLNAILGFSDFLHSAAATLEPGKVEEYAADIHKSGRYLLNLIDDVLDLSRIERGALPLDTHRLNVRQCVGEALETVRPMAGTRAIALACDVPADRHVRADRRALQQCLLNLLSNAVKFSAGGTTVKVDLTIASAGAGVGVGAADAAETGLPGGIQAIAVRNIGPAVPAEVLDHLGEPFVANTNPERAKQAGSGLGLAITRALMERMGGTLTLENVPGGAVAALHLPAAA